MRKKWKEEDCERRRKGMKGAGVKSVSLKEAGRKGQALGR
jgi:hypothetical protein